jgi:hypothetical protein
VVRWEEQVRVEQLHELYRHWDLEAREGLDVIADDGQVCALDRFHRRLQGRRNGPAAVEPHQAIARIEGEEICDGPSGKNAGIQGAAGDHSSRRFEIGRGGRRIQQGKIDVGHFLSRCRLRPTEAGVHR